MLHTCLDARFAMRAEACAVIPAAIQKLIFSFSITSGKLRE